VDPAPTTEVELPTSLSPSRASDFLTCPLLFRFRSIDRLPQEPSSAAVRGTVVHAALEGLYDLPREERTPSAAVALVEPAWQDLVEREPEVEIVAQEEGLKPWLERAGELVSSYFTLEDPRRLDPAAREVLVEAALPGGLTIRGYIDRLDVAPGGQIRIVDYKTGKAPSERFERKALFQMRFYALVLWRRDGVIPTQLKLLYLADGQALVDAPDAEVLLATERKIMAIWQAIVNSVERREFAPSPGPLCSWCDHQEICPAFGGTPPELPVISLVPAGASRTSQPADTFDLTDPARTPVVLPLEEA
jgi:putative RecB family exonuclease